MDAFSKLTLHDKHETLAKCIEKRHRFVQFNGPYIAWESADAFDIFIVPHQELGVVMVFDKNNQRSIINVFTGEIMLNLDIP